MAPPEERLQRPGRFLAARDNPDEPVVLLGAPLDATTSFRPGTRFAPGRIREMSDGLEEYSPALDADLADAPFCDAGDVALSFGDPEAALRAVEDAVGAVAGTGRFPLVLGGEHLLTMAAVAAVRRVWPDVAVVHIDAHADLRDDYLGQRLSHATVMRRVAELVGPESLWQVGIRSGTREEFHFGRRHTRFYPLATGGSLLEAVISVVDEIGDRPTYITLDIDVLDPAYAPGTGTPEPGGVHPADLFQALYALRRLPVVGMDIVEVCPPQDSSDITSIIAAKAVRESILSFGCDFVQRIWSGRR